LPHSPMGVSKKAWSCNGVTRKSRTLHTQADKKPLGDEQRTQAIEKRKAIIPDDIGRVWVLNVGHQGHKERRTLRRIQWKSQRNHNQKRIAKKAS